MKIKSFITYLLLMVSFYIQSQTYITNVTVADVNKQKLITNQTVVIEKDIIKNIKSSKKLTPSSNSTIIDGTGKFLFPGLTDAHIHFFQNGGLYTRPDGIDLRKYEPYNLEIEKAHKNMKETLNRYLQNGITNVIDVGATYNFLKHRTQFKDDPTTPSIYMTGPLITTYEPVVYKNLKHDEPFSLVKTPKEAINKVKEQLPYHPDFIKIWYIIDHQAPDTEKEARKYLPIIKATINEESKSSCTRY